MVVTYSQLGKTLGDWGVRGESAESILLGLQPDVQQVALLARIAQTLDHIAQTLDRIPDLIDPEAQKRKAEAAAEDAERDRDSHDLAALLDPILDAYLATIAPYLERLKAAGPHGDAVAIRIPGALTTAYYEVIGGLKEPKTFLNLCQTPAEKMIDQKLSGIGPVWKARWRELLQKMEPPTPPANP